MIKLKQNTNQDLQAGRFEEFTADKIAKPWIGRMNQGCIFQLDGNTYTLKHVGGQAIVDRFK